MEHPPQARAGTAQCRETQPKCAWKEITTTRTQRNTHHIFCCCCMLMAMGVDSKSPPAKQDAARNRRFCVRQGAFGNHFPTLSCGVCSPRTDNQSLHFSDQSDHRDQTPHRAPHSPTHLDPIDSRHPNQPLPSPLSHHPLVNSPRPTSRENVGGVTDASSGDLSCLANPYCSRAGCARDPQRGEHADDQHLLWLRCATGAVCNGRLNSDRTQRSADHPV